MAAKKAYCTGSTPASPSEAADAGLALGLLPEPRDPAGKVATSPGVVFAWAPGVGWTSLRCRGPTPFSLRMGFLGTSEAGCWHCLTCSAIGVATRSGVRAVMPMLLVPLAAAYRRSWDVIKPILWWGGGGAGCLCVRVQLLSLKCFAHFLFHSQTATHQAETINCSRNTLFSVNSLCLQLESQIVLSSKGITTKKKPLCVWQLCLSAIQPSLLLAIAYFLAVGHTQINFFSMRKLFPLIKHKPWELPLCSL